MLLVYFTILKCSSGSKVNPIEIWLLDLVFGKLNEDLLERRSGDSEIIDEAHALLHVAELSEDGAQPTD